MSHRGVECRGEDRPQGPEAGRKGEQEQHGDGRGSSGQPLGLGKEAESRGQTNCERQQRPAHSDLERREAFGAVFSKDDEGTGGRESRHS